MTSPDRSFPSKPSPRALRSALGWVVTGVLALLVVSVLTTSVHVIGPSEIGLRFNKAGGAR